MVEKVSTLKLVLVVFLGLMLVLGSMPLMAADTRGMTLDQRLSRLERALDNQNLAELMMGLERLQREVESLRGEVEVQAYLLKGMKKQQKELYLDIDQRMQQLEMASTPEVPAGEGFGMEFSPLPVEPEPAVPQPRIVDGVLVLPEPMVDPVEEAGSEVPAVAAPVLDEQPLYQRAFDQLKQGDYPAAKLAFQDFLAVYPQGSYADNAQYWLGEVHYVSKEFQQAITEFDKVIQAYPGSSKVPDALLKSGFSYYELQDWKQAAETLSRVVSQYPSSTAARLAERRLQQMKLEGRI